MKILIVEDDAPLANFIRKGLEAEHHTADLARDGNEGRAMAMEIDYDLVVLELTKSPRPHCSKGSATTQSQLTGPDFDCTQPDRRSCAVPRPGGGRLSRKTVFVS